MLIGLDVEVGYFLSGWCFHSLLEVAVKSAPRSHGFVGNTILGVDSLSFIGSLVLAVETLESSGESVADSVFLVKIDSLLNDVIREGVAMGQIFCSNS